MQVRADPVARTIEEGPQASGVYARFSSDGKRLDLLDELGQGVRTLHAGGGLIAATSQEAQQPTWVITGTDAVGVDAAAAARAKPCPRSQMRSSTASMPTDSRMVPGPTPAARSSSSFS